MKTILVPTDYSDAAHNALLYALEMAKAIKAKILLFHAYHIPLPSGDVPVMLVTPSQLEKENISRIKRLEKEIRTKHGPALKIEHHVAAGFVPQEILATAEEKKADLIVMGIKGESRLSRALMGSNTVSVIRKSTIPVLAIPVNAVYHKVEKVVLAYDYKGPIAEKTLNGLKEFLNVFKAKLMVLDVISPVEAPAYGHAVEGIALENALKGTDHALYFPEGEDVASEINSFADHYKADWLVMMPHKHNLFERIFHKSNTKQVTLHSHIPILTYHD